MTTTAYLRSEKLEYDFIHIQMVTRKLISKPLEDKIHSG